MEISCYCSHFLFQNQQVFCLGAHDDITAYALFMKPFYLRIHRGSSHASGNKYNFFLFQFFHRSFRQFGGTSQRPHKILEYVSFFQRFHTLCGCSHNLENNGNGSCFLVIITDSKRDSLAFFIHFHNYKLSRQTGSGHTGRLNIHKKNLICQLSLLYDWVHT